MSGFVRNAFFNLGYRYGPRIASALRKRWAIFRNPRATIRFGEGVYAGPGFSLHMPAGGTFIAGPWVEFRRNFRAELGAADASIVIGMGSHMTHDVILACLSTIEIGEGCSLGQCTFVADGSHRFRDLDTDFYEQGYDLRPIRIGDGAQIHSKCTIIADVGERAIVGGNAMVTRDIPPFTVAGGVPARVIDYYGPPGLEPEGFEAGAPDPQRP